MDSAADNGYAAAYAAAKLLAAGHSTRAAAKETGVTRRRLTELKDRAQQYGVSATSAVITEYLTSAEATADGRDGERTTSEIALAMNAGSLDEVKSQLRILQTKGIIINAKEEREKLTEPPPQTAEHEENTPDHQVPDAEAQPPARAATPERTPWVPQPPRDEDQLLDPAHWPGRKSTAVVSAVENLSYRIYTLQEKPFLEAAPTDEEVILAYILDPYCTRVLLTPEQTTTVVAPPDPDKPAAPAAPWPGPQSLYIEASDPLEAEDGMTFHGYLVPPADQDGNRPVVSISEARHRMYLGVLYVDLETGAAHCGSEHNGECNPEIHADQATAAIRIAALMGNGTMTELPVPRQQRRLAERRGLDNPWKVIEES